MVLFFFEFDYILKNVSGAADYQSFPMLLKQLVPPICTQLLDRRSSIVKQVDFS